MSCQDTSLREKTSPPAPLLPLLPLLSSLTQGIPLALDLLNYRHLHKISDGARKMIQMQCPKCQGSLEAVIFADIQVDRCTNCKGIWFDSQEAQTLRDIKGSESIDIGDPVTGRKFDEIGDINCPKCKTKMTKMVDLRQNHIWYEKCPVCYGIWFDAGEFKDYKEEGILDIFKDIFTGERR